MNEMPIQSCVFFSQFVFKKNPPKILLKIIFDRNKNQVKGWSELQRKYPQKHLDGALQKII